MRGGSCTFAKLKNVVDREINMRMTDCTYLPANRLIIPHLLFGRGIRLMHVISDMLLIKHKIVKVQKHV